MQSVADLVEPEALAHLATPANLRLGRNILDQGGVEPTRSESFRVHAKVGGVAAADQRRTVELISGPAGLQWSCTCTKRADLFCKHCVAAALIAKREAPPRPIPMRPSPDGQA
jgi:uncharacterized Zn finger protein